MVFNFFNHSILYICFQNIKVFALSNIKITIINLIIIKNGKRQISNTKQDIIQYERSKRHQQRPIALKHRW